MSWKDNVDHLPVNPAAQDAIWYDGLHGAAGSGPTVGSSSTPVNNWNDLIAIMIARHNPHAMLRTSITAGSDLTDNLFKSDCNPIFECDGCTPENGDVWFHINGKLMPGIGFKNLKVDDTVGNAASVVYFDHCTVGQIGTLANPLVQARVENHCQAYGPFYLSNSFFARNCDLNALEIDGNIGINIKGCFTDSSLPGGPSPLVIKGLTSAAIRIQMVRGGVTLDATCTGGLLEIWGPIMVNNNSTGAGTKIYDHRDKRNIEVPININAIVASPTNFLNLPLISGYAFQYMVDDLVLKCADPGANIVSVVLSKLVNGVLTPIHTFAITTAGALVRGVSSGFANYLSLDDMFTRQQLAGDQITITVQATAGGPYAVTGSYTYRCS